MANSIPPFSATFTPQIPELLRQLQCSILLTTHQAGKVVAISAQNNEFLSILPRSFSKPMGLDVQGDEMVIATKDEVIRLYNSRELAATYPKKPNTYDALFIPRTTHHTGQVDMHDVKFGKEGLYAINTSFSCLCEIGGNYNFIPHWKPNFITSLVSEDRCHLNGLVIKDGYPRYVTALGESDTPQGWRDHITNGGLLIDVKTDEIIFDDLAMPHSPQYYQGELYCLLSATGQLVKLDISKKEVEVVKDLNGFCRGMDFIGDYAIIGMSKLRKNSSTFAKLEFAEKADQSGIKIVHLPTRALVGEMNFQTSVDEIYEIKILLNTTRPNILSTENETYKMSLAIPEKTFWADPERENLQKQPFEIAKN